MLILMSSMAGKFIGDIDRIFFNSKSEILYNPPQIKEVVYNPKGEELKNKIQKKLFLMFEMILHH
jgi:hypothetical protein